MHADHVDNEDVASPRGHHVDVGEAGQDAHRPGRRRADGAQPEPEGHADRRHGHRLVVELAAHRAHEVRGDDRHDGHGCNRGVRAAGHLVGEQSREECGKAAEPRRHHAADVVHTHGHILDLFGEHWHAHEADLPHLPAQIPEEAVHGILGNLEGKLRHHLHGLPDEHSSHLHPRVDSGANRPSERVPGHVVVPLEELGQAVLSHVLSCTIIEPRVELVDDHAKVVD
mmetsp:Transcript_52869/g.136530  ORF Transcript_52869/g.136530 Transcript_52869/m.136530 type:complete len:227 (-) Transcript_52869:14-694(-)